MTVELDTTYTTIGTPIFYNIKVKSPTNKIIQFSRWDLEDPLELRSFYTQENQNVIFGQYELVFWDTGEVAIPGASISVLNSDSTFDYAMTADTMKIEVVSITQHDPLMGKDSEGVLPIKNPVPLRFTFPFSTILYSLILLALLIGIVLIWKKRLATQVSFEERPAYLDKPDIVALRKLENINQSGLLGRKEIKEFYAQLSFVLREYTENSLYLRTLEMTTEEIGTQMATLPFSNKEINVFLNILVEADLAKYAKHISSIEKCKIHLNEARVFIENTARHWKMAENI